MTCSSDGEDIAIILTGNFGELPEPRVLPPLPLLTSC